MGQATLSDSEFHMWRALFAFAFSDNVMSDKEKEILRAYQAQTAFSPDQMAILRQDFAMPKDPGKMFAAITEHHHRVRFCALARALMWCDGDPERQEVEILRRVGCLSSPDNIDILRSSRNSDVTTSYYQQYAKTGALGMFENVNTFRFSA